VPAICWTCHWLSIPTRVHKRCFCLPVLELWPQFISNGCRRYCLPPLNVIPSLFISKGCRRSYFPPLNVIPSTSCSRGISSQRVLPHFGLKAGHKHFRKNWGCNFVLCFSKNFMSSWNSLHLAAWETLLLNRLPHIRFTSFNYHIHPSKVFLPWCLSSGLQSWASPGDSDMLKTGSPCGEGLETRISKVTYIHSDVVNPSHV